MTKANAQPTELGRLTHTPRAHTNTHPLTIHTNTHPLTIHTNTHHTHTRRGEGRASQFKINDTLLHETAVLTPIFQ
jgi:hypothetical protein